VNAAESGKWAEGSAGGTRRGDPGHCNADLEGGKGEVQKGDEANSGVRSSRGERDVDRQARSPR